MQHQNAFESMDHYLSDIMSSVGKSGRPFGGISIVFGRDLRQILLVILKANRPQIIFSSLNR